MRVQKRSCSIPQHGDHLHSMDRVGPVFGTVDRDFYIDTQGNFGKGGKSIITAHRYITFSRRENRLN